MHELAATVLLAVHLLAMNIASAGPLAGAWLLTRRRAQGDGSDDLARHIVRFSLAALIVGSLVGGGLMVLPNPSMRAALARFPVDAFWFAGIELLFSAVCIAAILGRGRQMRHRGYVAIGLAILSSTNLLYHFPPLMAVIGELTADPHWAADERIDRAALLKLWARPEILALWAHFVLASLAVAPIAALRPWSGIALTSEGRAPLDQRVVRRLATCSLVATLLQIPVGLWLLVSTEAAARASMMGGSLMASLCFAGGVLAALWLLQTLAALALADDAALVRRAAVLLVVVTVLMSATLRTSRTAIPPQPRHSERSPVILSAAKNLDLR